MPSSRERSRRPFLNQPAVPTLSKLQPSRRAYAPSGLRRPGKGPTGLARSPPTPTSAFVTTGSTAAERSPCATTQSSTTSASVAHTKRQADQALVADRDIRVLDARTGELIRRLTLDPSRDYQPIGGAEVSTMSLDIRRRCRGTSHEAADGIRTHDLLHGNYAGLGNPRPANVAACRGFVVAPRKSPVENMRGYAPMCSVSGTPGQKFPKSP
jgi:hypothetical protein